MTATTYSVLTDTSTSTIVGSVRTSGSISFSHREAQQTQKSRPHSPSQALPQLLSFLDGNTKYGTSDKKHQPERCAIGCWGLGRSPTAMPARGSAAPFPTSLGPSPRCSASSRNRSICGQRRSSDCRTKSGAHAGIFPRKFVRRENCERKNFDVEERGDWRWLAGIYYTERDQSRAGAVWAIYRLAPGGSTAPPLLTRAARREGQ